MKINQMKQSTKVLCILLVIAIAVGCGFGGYQLSVKKEREELKALDNLDIEAYFPFREDSKIVRLPQPTSLHFSEGDDMPVLDGAAALFPVYSAFVNELYPNTIPMPNTAEAYDKGPFLYRNTIGGYSALAYGFDDIFFGVEPSESQIEEIKIAGKTLLLTPIGYDAFIFFVNRNNPVDNLTSEQVRKIYSGEITNWKELGGKDEEIVAYQRNQDSGSQTALENFMGETPLMKPPTDRVHDLMSGIIERVADYDNRHKGAIGFSFRYYTRDMIDSKRIKILSIDGVKPDIENITNHTYPIVNEIYAAVLKENDNPNVQKILDWVLSEEGQYIIEKTGYAPVAG